MSEQPLVSHLIDTTASIHHLCQPKSPSLNSPTGGRGPEIRRALVKGRQVILFYFVSLGKPLTLCGVWTHRCIYHSRVLFFFYYVVSVMLNSCFNGWPISKLRRLRPYNELTSFEHCRWLEKQTGLLQEWIIIVRVTQPYIDLFHFFYLSGLHKPGVINKQEWQEKTSM